jgi:hypothetical protein
VIKSIDFHAHPPVFWFCGSTIRPVAGFDFFY